MASSYKNRIGEVEARIRGASTQPHGGRGSKGPGSSFRVYEVTGCGARYVWHHKSEVAALEFLVRKLKRVAVQRLEKMRESALAEASEIVKMALERQNLA